MAADNVVVQAGRVPYVEFGNVENATNMIPGKVVKKGTSDTDIVVGTDGCKASGFLGYEQAPIHFKPLDKDTAFKVGDSAPVLKGGDYEVMAWMPASTTIAKDTYLKPGADGNLVAVAGVAGEVPIAQASESKTTTTAATRIKVRAI